MKTRLSCRTRRAGGPRLETRGTTAPQLPRRRRQEGVAVIVMLMILTIVLIYVGANYRWVYSLERELQLTEQKQIRRLNASSSTNAPSSAAVGEIPAVGVPPPAAMHEQRTRSAALPDAVPEPDPSQTLDRP